MGRILDLPLILADAGLVAVQYPGWRDRAARSSSGRIYPLRAVGALIHDDIIGPSDPASVAKFLAERGRPDLRAPLYNCWIDREGVWWLLAAGNANHAGRGDKRALDLIATDCPPVAGIGTRQDAIGNPHLYGICLANHPDHDDGHPRAQLDSLITGCAAIARAEGWTSDRFWRHGEFTNRKPDARLDGPWLRAAIEARTITAPEDLSIVDAETKAYLDEQFAKIGNTLAGYGTDDGKRADGGAGNPPKRLSLIGQMAEKLGLKR